MWKIDSGPYCYILGRGYASVNRSAQVLERVHRSLGVRISPPDFERMPSIRQLARHVQNLRAADSFAVLYSAVHFFNQASGAVWEPWLSNLFLMRGHWSKRRASKHVQDADQRFVRTKSDF